MGARGLELRELRVWREDALGGDARMVIDGLSLRVARGEHLALIGENGAGKTSLLLALVGAVPFTGEIAFDELTLAKKTLRQVRREVGFVFAEPSDQLFLPTVREEVAFGPAQLGVAGSELQTRVSNALTRMGLSGLEERSPGSLSLGQRRRLALCTALVMDPSVLLLDEPTASLDGRARRAVLRAMAETSSTLLFATHDLDAALELGARVALLKDGQLVATGAAADVLADERVLDQAGLDLPLTLRASRSLEQ